MSPLGSTIGVAAAAAAPAVELGARWWIRRRGGYYVWPPGLRLELRQDPGLFPQVEPRVRFEVNADGERGSDVPRKAPGLYRVLVAGGSSAECLALDQPTSWPGVVERLLGGAEGLRALGARRVHVGNIARSGVSSGRLDLILQHVLPRYRRLAAIVIMVGASDVLQWLEDGAPEAPGPDHPDVADVFAWHPQQAFGWTQRRSAALELARRLRRSYLRPLDIRQAAGSWVAKARAMRAQARELRAGVPDPTPILDRFERHLRGVVARARRCADRVLVVRQPWFDKQHYAAAEAAHFWHGGVGKAWKDDLTVFYSLDVLKGLMELVDARAGMVARELGADDLNLRPVLASSLENYFDFFHYTPAGAAVVGRTVAAVLLGQAPDQPPSPESRSPTPYAAPRVRV